MKQIAFVIKISGVTVLLLLGGIFYFPFFQIPTAAALIVPELPRVYVDTSFPVLSSARTVYNVRPSCSGISNCFTTLQPAIDAASLGDEIVVEAGMTLTGPIRLRNKTTGTGWILIRSSSLSSLPLYGNRVNPTQSALMPKIVAPGSNVSAIVTDNYAHHYWLSGIEVAKVDTGIMTASLVALGNYELTTLAPVPHHIVLDRMYIHGEPHLMLKRCVGLDGAHMAVVNSYISECHNVGQDSQAIAGLYGPGPFKIYNNYLEASSENLLFGGDVPRIIGLNPSDIEIRNNYMTKNLAWRGTQPDWVMKNVFELKQGVRVLVDGNIMERSWTDGQTGPLVVLTPRNSGGCRTCGATWAAIQDVTIINNIIRSGGQAVQISGYDYYASDGSNAAGTEQTRNILFKNNVFYDINRSWGGSHSISITDSPANVGFDHNTFETVDAAGVGNNTIALDGRRSDGTFDVVNGFELTNNMMTRGGYGIFGSSLSEGTTTLNAYAPGAIFEKTVMASDVSITSRYPSTNSCPTTCYPTLANWRAQFSNYANGIGGDVRGFALSTSSVYRNAGTDGLDIGADTNAVYNATRNVISGNLGGSITPTPPPPPPSTPTIYVSPTSLSFASTSVGNTSTRQRVALYNEGSSQITLDSITTTGDFTIETNYCHTGAQPNTHCDVYVVFNPQASGTRTGSLVFRVTNGSTYTVSLTGTATVVNTIPKSITLDLEGRTNLAISGNIEVLNSSRALIRSYPFTTNSSGSTTLNMDDISGSLYFKVKISPYLTRMISGTMSTTLSFLQFKAGDLNQDNIINSIDYSQLNSRWFQNDSATDLNQDGMVNSLDYSLMNRNWLATGEQ